MLNSLDRTSTNFSFPFCPAVEDVAVEADETWREGVAVRTMIGVASLASFGNLAGCGGSDN